MTHYLSAGRAQPPPGGPPRPSTRWTAPQPVHPVHNKVLPRTQCPCTPARASRRARRRGRRSYTATFASGTDAKPGRSRARYPGLVLVGSYPPCPHCDSDHIGRKADALGRWTCHACHASFTVLSGTIFSGTRAELPKWFLSIALVLNAKKSLSSLASRIRGCRC